MRLFIIVVGIGAFIVGLVLDCLFLGSGDFFFGFIVAFVEGVVVRKKRKITKVTVSIIIIIEITTPN